jgi:hypothetical protein|tara:strand:+ start:3991 stop:4317 length:327 start_codon:yes stop_codon:yes gene_type:complete
MAFKMKGVAIDKTAMPMKGHANTTAMYKNGDEDDKGPGQGTKKGQYTGSGIPPFIYDADGTKINTDNIDEGNLSEIKVESGTDRKYVVMQEKSDLGDAGARFYLSNPK